MHFALLIGYGAGAICPYLAYETTADMVCEGVYGRGPRNQGGAHQLHQIHTQGIVQDHRQDGISTIQSYRGAQIFEAVGLNEAVIAKMFRGNPLQE